MSEQLAQKGAVFIGSLPYATANDAFTGVSDAVGKYLKYLPDGETGVRYNFVGWQIAKYPKQLLHADMGGDADPKPLSAAEAEKLLGNHQTDYDTAAIESYAIFKKLRDEGKIPSHLKMAVCVPTAINCMGAIAYVHRPAVEPHIEAALKRALRNIQDSIPHKDLLIQIDCSAEFVVLDRSWLNQYVIFKPFWGDGDVEKIDSGLHERITNALKGVVDDDVELGIHLCYGDFNQQHHTSPSSKTLVAAMKTILETAERRVDYIHMPVPTDISGEEYFHPLLEVGQLLSQHNTTVYLGFIYPKNLEGNSERVALARRVLGDKVPFGIGSYCGLGRQKPEAMQDVFREIQTLSKPVHD